MRRRASHEVLQAVAIKQGRAVQLQVAVLGRASPLRIFSRTASERVPTVQCSTKCKIGNNSECDA